MKALLIAGVLWPLWDCTARCEHSSASWTHFNTFRRHGATFSGISAKNLGLVIVTRDKTLEEMSRQETTDVR